MCTLADFDADNTGTEEDFDKIIWFVIFAPAAARDGTSVPYRIN